MRRAFLIVTLSLATINASAQWDIQDSGTKASLRGIHSLGKGIAWASGTDGTVLRTEDGGYLWQRCTTPPGAEKLDFRGIQAFDANTAIVMSSGTGDLSRIYKTTDGCQTWKLVYANPDAEGFFDSIAGSLSPDRRFASTMIAGDPVSGGFTLFYLRIPMLSSDTPQLIPFPEDNCDDPQQMRQLPMPSSDCMAKLITITDSSLHSKDQTPSKPSDIPAQYKSPVPRTGEALFAASNSSLAFDPRVRFAPNIAFVTGGPKGARFLHYRGWPCRGMGCVYWRVADVPLAASESSGAFSLATTGTKYWKGVIVGGNYQKPDEAKGTGAYTQDEGKSWQPSETPPHGYRSAVAYNATTKTWITVGPNGTDISTDDGRNWHALKPGPNDAPDADQNWNALSLPFVVGPHGRIGVLRPDALKPAATH